jgi:hypothetical protein
MTPRTRLTLGILLGVSILIVPTAVAAVQAEDPVWVAPVNAPIWDGFRPPGREYHQGVDFGAPKWVPIRAASSGTVVVRECNAHVNGTPYPCDIDGSVTVRGCGWFIDIAHPGGIITRYCHMAIAPLVELGETVTTGQRIGYVGSSGNSSAPHLHFEVHVIPKGQVLDAEPENAVNPIDFMEEHGASLGRGNDEPTPPPPAPPTPPDQPSPHEPAADLDGDGATDLAVWRPSDGQWHVLAQSEPTPLGVPGDVPVVADYDGDGRDDLAVWRRADGRWLVQTSSGAGVSDPVHGTEEDFPVPGDYDGDGKTDFAVWRPFEGAWLILRSDGTPTTPVVLGGLGDLPVVADYDGDGLDDLAVWRASDGRWLIETSSDIDLPEITLGVSGDVPVPGDYDGDGLDDYAVWRPAEAQFYVRYAVNTEAELPVAVGAPGDVPVAGDYNGDGRDDLAVWRPAEGRWLVRVAADQAVVDVMHGVVGDVPANRPLWLKDDGTAETVSDTLARRFAIALREATEAAALAQAPDRTS